MIALAGHHSHDARWTHSTPHKCRCAQLSHDLDAAFESTIGGVSAVITLVLPASSVFSAAEGLVGDKARGSPTPFSTFSKRMSCPELPTTPCHRTEWTAVVKLLRKMAACALWSRRRIFSCPVKNRELPHVLKTH